MGGFYHADVLADTHVLLAGGGTKPLSDFLTSLPSHSHSSYLPKESSVSDYSTWNNSDWGFSEWTPSSSNVPCDYGTSLNFRDSTTWYYRLMFGTDGRIYYRNGINTTTISARGTIAYLSDLSGYASSGHNHTLKIEVDSGTPNITLSANTTYKLTAGGSTYLFKTPTDLTGSGGDGNTQYYLTLNGTVKGTSSTTDLGSFYAPTSAGTSGQYLKSNGSGAPTWASFDSISVTNNAATIGTSLTTIATISGTAITAKIGDYLPKTWTNSWANGTRTFGKSGLKIEQVLEETSGISFNGDYINMWSPCDSYTLRYWDEDDGSEIWSIDSDGYFSGSCDYADNATYASYALNLRSGTQITNLDSGTMYNKIYYHNNTATGNPSSISYGNLLVISNRNSCTPGSSLHWIQQIDFTHDNKIWHRQRINDNAWTSWEVILTSANYSSYISTSGGSVSVGSVTSGTYQVVGVDTSNTSALKYLATSGGHFYFTTSGAYHTSDERMKHDIWDILQDDVDELFGTNNGYIRHFAWNSNDVEAYGFIAQELEEFCPEAIHINEDGYYGVNYNVAFSKILGAMFKKIKQQDKEIKKLKKIIEKHK